MICPRCQHDDDRVKASRGVRGGTAVKRRRICNNCGYRWTTTEQREDVLRAITDAVKESMDHLAGKGNGDGR